MRRWTWSALALLALAAAGAAAYLYWPRHAPKPPPAGMCAEHGVAEADCPFCRPEIVAERGLCGEHGVPEALCVACRPALAAAFQAEGDWCAEHATPESQCRICNPGTAATPDVAVTEEPRAMRSPSPSCRTERLRVRLKTPEAAREAGLRWERVERREVPETLRANGRIEYDGSRFARLAPRAPGIVREIVADLGRAVAAGDPVAWIDSTALGEAKADYQRAAALLPLREQAFERLRVLREQRGATDLLVQQAEGQLAEARIEAARAEQALANLGVAPGEAGDSSPRLAVRSPIDGIVVERDAVLGEAAEPARPLFAVADVSHMWALLDLYESDLPKVRPGQAVVVALDGLRGETFGGRVTWISAHVDPRSRTLQVRAEVENRDGILRAGMLCRAEITVREREPALIIPREALQWEGCCNVVFVRERDDLFAPRKVRVAGETERVYVVEEGLAEGDEVVTVGAFLLKTEILKGSIGAGCCEVVGGR